MRLRRWLVGLALLALVAQPVWGQRLLLGAWQGWLGQSMVTLTIITADGEGWLHGILRYDPPQADGFAGAPFTTRIENGEFSIRLLNGTRFGGLHWCGDELCGTYHAPDDTATPMTFARSKP